MNKKYSVDVKKVIKCVRIASGLPQTSMAIMLNVSRAHYNAMENGQRKVSLNIINKFSKEFKFPLPPLIAERNRDGKKLFEFLSEHLVGLIRDRVLAS